MPSAKVSPKKHTLTGMLTSIVCFSFLLLIIGMAILLYQKSGVGGIYFNHPLDFGYSVNNKS
jgi:hypothetical protein